MTRFISISILSLAVLFCSNALAVNNPASYLTEINDCDVIKYNGEYHIQGNWLRGDMLVSRDLESWGGRKHVYSWTASWHTAVNATDPDYDIHGTHIRYHNGTFHLYAHLDVSDGIVHAVSPNIWGPYTEPVDANFAGNIDADTFQDDDGSLFFYSTRFISGNQNYVRPMSSPSAFSGNYAFQISRSEAWENSSATAINEGPKVFKYRNRYYMLYNGNGTGDPNYSIGCVEASSPTGFSNAGKYSDPICTRTTPPGADEIAYVGQAWVVDGLNGFEKWMGYFAQTTSEGRTQRIDRMHFFDRHLFVDGPTDRHTTGYHPGPAKPQLLNIFSVADGSLSSKDWTEQTTGSWAVASKEAVQSDQSAWALNTVNRDSATNYLIEANVKMTEAQDAEDKAGVLAYYEDADNFAIVGLDRSTGYGADSWYCHVKENGADTIYSGGYGGSLDYSVYHKIRVTKNGGNFDIRIDDMIPPGHSTIATAFTGAGIPGIYTDHAAAAFDGIIYTIGWDEFDTGVTGWGDNINGVPMAGSWSVGANGITMASGTGYTFKGDLMPEYEFATQVYKEGATDGKMGIFAVAIDAANYVIASITNGQLVVEGVQNGTGFAEAPVSVASKTDYNLRVAKLSDRVVFFVDGVEKLTLNRTYGAAQVGLYVAGMSARFNGIMAYRTEPAVLPIPWTKNDIGAVGFPGTVDYRDHALYMSGSGSDIWGGSDEFTFVNTDATGDWEVSARVVNLDESDYFAKSGIMFRESLAANSPMVMVHVSPGNSAATYNPPKIEQPKVHLLWRDAAGASAADTVVNYLDFPIWIKLKRTGNAFTGYYSSDGQSWTQVATHTVALNAAGKLGFGATAHNNSRLATTVLDNIVDPVGFDPVPVGIPENVHVGDFTALTAPFRLHASDFVSSFGYSFAASQWQISSDSGFASTNWDSGVSAPLTYSAVPANVASPGDYGRARYQNDQGEWSAWSAAYLLDLSSHTIAHWRFEEGTNGVTHAGDQDNFYVDSSGNGNHMSSWWSGSRPTATSLTPYSTVPQIGSRNNLAMDFSGGNTDLGTFAAQTGAKMIESYIFNQGWTVEATFKLNSLGWQVIVGKDGRRGDLGGAVGVEAPFWMKLLASSKKLEVLVLDDNDTFHYTQSSAPLESNKWYSAVATYDNAHLKLYLRGETDADYVFQSSVAIADGVSLGGFNNPWSVGRGMFDGNPVDFVDGVIDEVRISDLPLNPASFLGAAVAEGYDFDVDGMADDWELGYFNSIADAVPSEDPDDDLLDNFAEYAMGGDPTDPADTGYPITFEPDGEAGFNYVYPRRTSPAGVAYRLETTTNLVSGSWTNSGYAELPNPGTFDPRFEAVTNQVPTAGTPQKFIRLIVE